MTKDELKEVVAHANACWSKAPYKDELVAQQRAWWTFLQDLDKGVVMRELNRMSLTRTYLPRPAEVRTAVLAPEVPTAVEGWATLQEVRRHLTNGTDVPALNPFIKTVIRSIGDVAYGLQSNGDREYFTQVFNKAVEKHIEQVCQVK